MNFVFHFSLHFFSRIIKFASAKENHRVKPKKMKQTEEGESSWLAGQAKCVF